MFAAFQPDVLDWPPFAGADKAENRYRRSLWVFGMRLACFRLLIPDRSLFDGIGLRKRQRPVRWVPES